MTNIEYSQEKNGMYQVIFISNNERNELLKQATFRQVKEWLKTQFVTDNSTRRRMIKSVRLLNTNDAVHFGGNPNFLIISRTK